MNIALVGIHVNDPLQAYTYYTEVLGFASRMYMPEHLLAIVASPEEPGGTGLLLEPSDNPIAKAYQSGLYEAGMPCIVFGVDDVQAEYERLLAKGVSFKQAPTRTDWGTVEAMFDDTCGNFVQIAQVTRA